MNYKSTAHGLGLFSIGLGLAELIGGKRIARMLGVEKSSKLVRGFGARELAAGGALIAQPAHSTNTWMRVAGDAMDLAALGMAARRSRRQKAVWSSIAVVAAITALDVMTARGLDRTSGKLLPVRA